MCSPICLVGSCACQACTQCCGATLGESMKQQVRVGYIIFDAVYVAISLVLLYFASDWLSGWEIFLNCPKDTGLTCLGVSAIFRMSFALLAMHLFVMFFVLMRNECSRSVNEEIWFFKVFLVSGLFIGSFWISNDFFAKYAQYGMYLSVLFLLFQIIMIIDICYLLNKNWVQRYDEGENCFMYLLIFFTAVLYGIVIYANIEMFGWFEGCGRNYAIIINIIFVIAATVLILLGLNKDGSIFTTSMVSAYTTYLTWSGLTSISDGCNTWKGIDLTTTLQIILGVIFILISLIYTSVGNADDSQGAAKEALVSEKEEAEQNKEADSDGEDDGDEERPKKKKLVAVEPQSDGESRPKKGKLSHYQDNTHITFHLIMIFAAIYIAPLLSNWGSTTINGDTFASFESGDTAILIKLASGWATMALYIWTIVAPALFPDRDFS